MKIKKMMLLLFLIILLFARCDTTEPPTNGSLTLTLEDVSCTEAWLTLKSTNLQIPNSIVLTQNNQARLTINLTTADTLLYIDSLLPNQTYKFQSVILRKESFGQPFNQSEVRSNELSVTTMDTTSHNFTWQTFTFGEHSSSVLYDVAIINENNIWAVGEIYMNDSLGLPDTTPFNAVHWNGTNWEILRIPTKTFSGTIVSAQIKSIFAFNENDIWMFSIAGSYSHWNGSDWKTEFVNERMGSGNKLWGTSSSNLYLVCTNGGISYYNGSSWAKIESGTTMNLFDIGSSDGKNIYLVGGNFNLLEGVLLRGNSGGFKIVHEGKNISADEIFKPYFAGISKTVCVSGKNTVFFGGNFLYQYKLGVIDFVKSLPGNYFNQNSNGEHWGFISMLRGNEVNDLIMVGEGNTVRHFNGTTWKQLGMPYNYSSNYTWLSVDMKVNIIASVGRSNVSTILILLKRYINSERR